MVMSIEHAFPWTHRALVRRLLGFLRGDDVLHLTQSHRACLEAVLPVLQHYQHSTARLGLAIWCMRSLCIEFQAHYQELETQRIARSRTRDPRVPPRVVSIWSERGKVHGGAVMLRPSALPLVHCDGITVQFAVDAADGKMPMLSNVVQTQRRIYTMVTLKLLRSPASGDPLNGGSTSANATSTSSGGDQQETGDDATILLRQYSYIKEFGEWVAPSALEKQRLDDRGRAPCRFDLLSQDGSVALELDVPSGADSLLDYYLVKRAVVSIHMDELLQRYFASIRPLQSLPLPSVVSPSTADAADCVISLHFRTLRGEPLCAYTAPGRVSLERGERGADATGAQHESSVQPSATGVEHFDIVTCKAQGPIAAVSVAATATIAPLSSDPGYLWLRVRAASSGRSYFHAAMLHRGASFIADGTTTTLHACWLPGVLESFPTLDSRQRRCLKGHVTLSCARASGALEEITIVAQHLDAARLTRYAASVRSYARIDDME